MKKEYGLMLGKNMSYMFRDNQCEFNVDSTDKICVEDKNN